jgi:hypothetical protein
VRCGVDWEREKGWIGLNLTGHHLIPLEWLPAHRPGRGHGPKPRPASIVGRLWARPTPWPSVGARKGPKTLFFIILIICIRIVFKFLF